MHENCILNNSVTSSYNYVLTWFPFKPLNNQLIAVKLKRNEKSYFSCFSKEPCCSSGSLAVRQLEGGIDSKLAHFRPYGQHWCRDPSCGTSSARGISPRAIPAELSGIVERTGCLFSGIVPWSPSGTANLWQEGEMGDSDTILLQG